MSTAFISYSHRDKQFALRLADDLRSSGISVWIDEQEMRIGDSMIERISKALKQVEYVVALLSRHSVDSRWVQEELKQAYHMQTLGKRIMVLPVILDNCPIPEFLEHRLYADFTDSASYADSLRRLVMSIGEDGSIAVKANAPTEADVLRRLFVPQFLAGRSLHPWDLLQLQQAINGLECFAEIRTTRFEPFYFGQFLRARDLNQLVGPIRSLLKAHELDSAFKFYPVADGMVLLPEHLNELADKINSITRKRLEYAEKGFRFLGWTTWLKSIPVSAPDDLVLEPPPND